MALKVCVCIYICIFTCIYMAANQKHWPCNRLGRPFRDKGLYQTGVFCDKPLRDKPLEDYSTLHGGPRQGFATEGPRQRFVTEGGSPATTRVLIHSHIYIYMYVHIYICVYVYMCICIRQRARIHMRTYLSAMHMFLSVHLAIYTYTFSTTYICIYLYLCICVYIYIHIFRL